MVFKVSSQAVKNLPEECCLCQCSAVFDPALHCWGMLDLVSDLRWELALGLWVLGTDLSFPSFFPGTSRSEKYFGEYCHLFFLSNYSLN